MQTIAVNTCDCGREDCLHSETLILCVCAEDEDDKVMIQGLVDRLEATEIELPPRMVARLWQTFEGQVDVFKASKDLLKSMER